MSASDLVVAIEQKDDELAAAEKELEELLKSLQAQYAAATKKRMTPRRRLKNLASGS